MGESTNKNIKINKRIISIIVISILSFLVVLEGVLCYSYYRIANTQSKNSQKIIDALQERIDSLNELNPTLNEIIRLYNGNYIYDVNDEELELKLIETYLTNTNDKYAYYYTAEEWDEYQKQLSGKSYGIGVLVIYDKDENTITVAHVYKNGPAYNAGIKKGDILLGTDTLDFKEMEYSDAISTIKGEMNTEITIRVKRNGVEQSFNVTRGDYDLESVFLSYEMVGDKQIAVVKIEEFYEFTVNEFYKAILDINEKPCDGVVFDLRDNPGGLLSSVIYMLDMLVESKKLVTIRYIDDQNEITSTSAKYLSKPCVVLINENSASAAELFTSTLQDYDIATVIGTRSYGKGCGQTMFNLSNGGVVKLTTFLYDPPLQDNYDGMGITPDIVIEMNEDYKDIDLHLLEKENDNQLQYALNYIATK